MTFYDYAGYSTASSVEDWALALEICERASLNESNAKEAATALKKEFKYVIILFQAHSERLRTDIIHQVWGVCFAAVSSPGAFIFS